MICQPCKDKEDTALWSRIKSEAAITKKILRAVEGKWKGEPMDKKWLLLCELLLEIVEDKNNTWQMFVYSVYLW